MWSIEQLAYFAGLFDGEGHLSVDLQRASKCRKKDYYSLRFVIANTNLEVIQWLINTFNGTLQIDKKIKGCKQGYKFLLWGPKMFAVLEGAYPYMIVKKPIVEVAFEFKKTIGKTGWKISDEILTIRKQLYLKAHQINKKGDHNHTSALLP